MNADQLLSFLYDELDSDLEDSDYECGSLRGTWDCGYYAGLVRVLELIKTKVGK